MGEGKTQKSDSSEVPWHAAFPAPQTVPGSVARHEVLAWLKEDKSDFVLIDLRRMDCEGGLIRGSINLPAHSLYHTIPALYKLFSAAMKKKIVCYCGASRGRGPRAAGWFADFLKEKSNDSMESVTLEGGIKGWATGGGEYIDWMDGYDEAAWKESS